MVLEHRAIHPLSSRLRLGLEHLTTTELRLLALIAEGVNPAKITSATFPQTGVWEPLPSGRTVFDLSAMRANAPHRDFDLTTILSASEIRSWVIAVDGLCAVEAQPIAQKFVMPPGVIEIASRDIQRIIFEADAGFLMQMAWSTTINGIDVWVPSVLMLRYSSTLVTKTNGVGVADSFAALLFVPRVYTSYSGERTLVQADFGDASISTLGYVNKGFLVRNTGNVDVDVRVRGAMFSDVLTTYGAVNDPDTGVGGGSPVTVPSNSAVMLRSSTPFLSMRVEARVSAHEAAASSSTVIVEVHAQLPSAGGR